MMGYSRLKRGLLAVAVLAILYGVAAQIGSTFLPRRVWIGAHYIENVEFIPTYASLAEEVLFLVRSGGLQGGIIVSTTRVLEGLLLGSAIGVPLGLGMALAVRVEYLLDPWVTFFRFTPALGLLSLYVLWFGFGESSKILLIATGVAVVTLLGTYQGVRNVRRVYFEAAASLGLSTGMILRRIILPAAFPQILSSVRIAVALAWTTIVVAELIDAKTPSLGYMLTLAAAYPRVPTILTGIATIGVMVVICDGISLGLLNWATRWMRRKAEHASPR